MYNYHLSIDIGASSGKAIVGYLDASNNLNYEVIYRFKNDFKMEEGHKVWDLDYLLKEVKNILKIALKNYPNLKTFSIDTWGCDYVLLDENEKEILPCFSYRDERTKDILDEVLKKISKEEIFNLTGSQFQPFNTIYQLYYDFKNGRLKKAKYFLMLPEYLLFKLTGKKVHEITNASTTSLLAKDEYDYSSIIIDKLGFPKHLFTKPKKVGYCLGYLKEEISNEVGGNVLAKLVPTHDTASVIRLIEDKLDENSLYLSSGTWSLLGVKLDHYLVSKEVYTHNFSNELGPSYIRFQKNIMGLWLSQRLDKELGIHIENAIALAKLSKISNIYIDVNDDRFLSTSDMKKEIISYLKEKGYINEFKDEDIYRIVFTSLAKSYRTSIEEIEKILNKKFNKIFVLGGGAKNKYLNDLIKEETKLTVIAYPFECGALGNLISQMEDEEA